MCGSMVGLHDGSTQVTARALIYGCFYHCSMTRVDLSSRLLPLLPMMPVKLHSDLHDNSTPPFWTTFLMHREWNLWIYELKRAPSVCGFIYSALTNSSVISLLN